MNKKNEVLDPKFVLEVVASTRPTWRVKIGRGQVGFLRSWEPDLDKSKDFGIQFSTSELPGGAFNAAFKTRTLALAALEKKAREVFAELQNCDFRFDSK